MSEADAPSVLSPGTLLSNTYVIEEHLARGGIGEVYRARHIELGTEHAIQVMLPSPAEDPKIVQVFREEARKLGRIKNDAVVDYQGFFRGELGLRYLVTEFVHGERLAEVLFRRRLEPDEVLRLRDRLALGLAAAHEMGIVHRYVSPENILLPEDRIDRAKLIGFGIAKADPAALTIIGSDFAGKYSYISPERVGLFGGRVDLRSDIYSLGLVLAAAAIGFGRKLDMGNSAPTVIAARQRVPDLTEVPASLRPVIAPMLEPRPDDRLPSLRALLSVAVSDALTRGSVEVGERNVSPRGTRARDRAERPQGGERMPSEIIHSVFVSSTYEDLREERAAVQKALLQLHCMPIGMELFGSADQETWEFIKRQIEECDYYVVIMADKYGSTAADGLSYTEKEYDYARKIKKPVLAFVHANRGSIPRDKTETDAEKRQKLDAFIQKVRQSPVSFFNSPHDLATQVTVSFVNLRDRHPAVGFVRADHVRVEPAPFTVQDVYLERDDSPTTHYHRKLRIVLKNDSGKDVSVRAGTWRSVTGDILIQPVGKHVWRSEGSQGWQNDSWLSGEYEEVIARPGMALQTWIGLDISADEIDIRRRQITRRLGTLIVPLTIDGEDDEQGIRL